MSDDNELTEQDRHELQAHTEKLRAAARVGEPADPHGFGARERRFWGDLRSRLVASPTQRAAETKVQADSLAAMTQAWREAQPLCTHEGALQCNSDRLAVWTDALAENEARERASAIRRQTAAWRAAVPRRLHAVGAPARAIAAWDAGPVETEAVRAAWALVAGLGLPGPARKVVLLLLCGGPGSGKTTGAVCALGDYMATAAGQPRGGNAPLPCYVLAAAECARVGLYGEEARSMLMAATTADVLLLDDSGMEAVSEKGPWLSVFDMVVSARHGEYLPTIITSNLAPVRRRQDAPPSLPDNPPGFFDVYGERVRSRFRDAGFVVNTGTTDMRRSQS